VAACPAHVRNEFERDLNSSCRPRQALARLVQLVLPFQLDEFLVDVPQEQRVHVLMVFAPRVRAGAFGKGQQVGCQAVATTLRHVSQAFVLASFADPRSGDTGPELGLAFTWLYHSYKNEDPALQPQLALPVSVFEDIVRHEGTSVNPKDRRAAAGLVVIAFFFLLRVGEYTPPSGNCRT
jgi:hypothetical protein